MGNSIQHAASDLPTTPNSFRCTRFRGIFEDTKHLHGVLVYFLDERKTTYLARCYVDDSPATEPPMIAIMASRPFAISAFLAALNWTLIQSV